MAKEMATHSSVLAWRIPGTAEPGGVPTLQGPCNLSQKWRGTLRFLPDLEIRPSSIAAYLTELCVG